MLGGAFFGIGFDGAAYLAFLRNEFEPLVVIGVGVLDVVEGVGGGEVEGGFSRSASSVKLGGVLSTCVGVV